MLSNLTMCYKTTNKKKSYKNIKFKISVPTENGKFELHNESYDVSDIQDYFEHIIKKYRKVTDNPSIRIHVGLHLNNEIT